MLHTIFCVVISSTDVSAVDLLLGVRARGVRHFALQLGWYKIQELIDLLHTIFCVIISSTEISAVGLLLGVRARGVRHFALQLGW